MTARAGRARELSPQVSESENRPTSASEVNDNTEGYLGEAREPKPIQETLKSVKVDVLLVLDLIHADFNNIRMSRHLYKCKKKGVMVLQIGFCGFLFNIQFY